MKHNNNYWRKRRGETIIPRKNKSTPLPDNWNELRTTIKNRDVVCQDCSNDDWLGVHHKDENRLNNELGNLTLLCWPCHRTRHHVRLTFHAYGYSFHL